MADHREIQKVQFKKISTSYEEVHGRVISGIYRVLQKHYYSRCSGKKILDLGNGGQPPSKIFGQKIAATITTFVGLDNSMDMLKRKESNYIRIAGDGIHLPFKDKTFDYVILNGVIHHLGFFHNKDQFIKIEQFVDEAFRVCTQELIVYELVTSKWLEQVEKFIAAILGHLPTFVLSEFTLDKYLNRMGVIRNQIISKKLSDLTNPFYWYLICMDYQWIKLPAFLSPFKHIFFVLSK